MDVYILDCKYQVKSHSFPWFSGVCTAVTAHRNHFLHLYQQSKSSASKVKFRQASNHYKRVLELNYANKTKKSITSQKLGSCDFLQINNSVPNKGKQKKLYKPQYVSKYLEEIGCMPYSLKRWQTFNNYRPVSLLPICGKIFERLVSYSLFKYLEKSALQSGCLANDSCVDQLMSFVHNIDTAFDTYPTLEYCEVFLDMSKVVDKVWHGGLIFKLKSVGTSNVLLDFIESLSENRFQRVVMMNAVAKI